MSMFKQILLMLGAIIVAGIIIAIVETIGHSVRGSSPFVTAIGGYAAGSAGGGFLIGRLGGPRLLAILLFLILAMLAGYNLFAFPHPLWFAPSALITLAAGTFAADRLARKAMK